MKISKLIYSIFVGFVLFSFLIFSEGDTGLKAMEKVESYRKMLDSNLESIRKINEELTVEFDSLSTDNDLIKLKARALGYFDINDHLVHIENWNPDYNEYRPGFVIKKEYLSEVDETPFRLIAVSGFLISLVIMVLFEMAVRNRISSHSINSGATGSGKQR